MKKALILGAAALALALSGTPAIAQVSDAVAAAVANPARPAADTARDGDRKPGEIVTFAGVKPGDKVAELLPGGGYFTRIISRTVGPEGRVYALVPAGFANRPGGLDALNALAAELGNVTVVATDLTSFTLPEKVDLAWTTENYHDMHNGPAPSFAGVNSAVFAALKPGGLYFVEDHSAPGTGVSATSTIHRIDPEAVKAEAAAAGFVLDAESDLLVNPKDPGDISPRQVTDGVSTKFVLRFRKPE